MGSVALLPHECSALNGDVPVPIRQPYNEPAPDDEADDILFTAEPPREQGVNSDALALVSPNRVVSGAALMKDTEELASTSETAEYLDGTAARHGPLAPTSQQPQQPRRPENASPAFMNCSADEAELDVPPANADDSTLDQSPTATCAALMSDTFAVLEQDVMRTRRGLAAFERPATRARLTLWLCAFCDEHGVPYMQGMNEIAAVFVYLHETLHADATTCACYAMYKRFAERYVPLAVDPAEDPFGRLKQAFRLFNDLLWFHDPEVASRLERYQLSTDMYATAWLVTVFARNLAMEAVLAGQRPGSLCEGHAIGAGVAIAAASTRALPLSETAAQNGYVRSAVPRRQQATSICTRS
ncbi:hypothetical protein CCYA_CCYA03G1140 [Cyanidiococcus yangmingshanensis]|nr:hypothetical protein CCYA_CCYA03G1140 [Cyanidiococcus yangmingshanensis]